MLAVLYSLSKRWLLYRESLSDVFTQLNVSLQNAVLNHKH